MMKIGIIGNGKSANRYHLPFLLQRKDKIKVKTIVTNNLENKTWNRIDGINYTDKIEELYNDPEIDLVVICLRSDLHYKYAKKVLEHGKNCLVEKPFVETLEEAQELFRLAKEKGLIVQPYHNRRFDSDFLTTMKVIESGKLGEILEIESNYDYYRAEVPENVNEYDGKQANTFLYGHGTHVLDQIISRYGNPDKVHYDVRQLLGTNRMNDYYDIDLFYERENGKSLKVSLKGSYFRIKPRASFIVYGTKGCFIKETEDRQEEHLKLFYMPDNADFGIDLPKHYGTLIYYDNNGNYHEEKVISEKGDYGRVYDDLYEAIKNGKEKTVKDEEILCQIKILEEGSKDLK